MALVVDDDALLRCDMADMLGDLGFDVAEADSVASALIHLTQQGERVSLLVTDVQMPGTRSGLTLANHVSFMWPHIRILVISGAMRPVVGALPYEAQFIAKPLTPHALTAYVSRFPSDMLPQQPS